MKSKMNPGSEKNRAVTSAESCQLLLGVGSLFYAVQDGRAHTDGI